MVDSGCTMVESGYNSVEVGGRILATIDTLLFCFFSVV